MKERVSLQERQSSKLQDEDNISTEQLQGQHWALISKNSVGQESNTVHTINQVFVPFKEMSPRILVLNNYRRTNSQK